MMPRNLDFEKLLEDEYFIRILIPDSPDSKQYIEKLIKENPDKKEAILNAAQFIKSNKELSPEILSKDEVNNIWANITERTKSSQEKITLTPMVKKRKFLIPVGWRIAASVLVLMAFTALVYLKFNNVDPYKNITGNVAGSDKEAVIILSDGSKHVLEDNNAHIEYKSGGREILINNPDNKTERFTDRKAIGESALNQIIVPFGRRYTITLSDGTVVQLNSGSKLVYPPAFSGKTREVYISGEGYFDVTRNTDKIFIVNTDHIKIKVTGTRFNISAYQDEQIISTVLIEGSVQVSQKSKVFNNPQYNLNPGQACFYAVSTSTAEVKKVNVRDHVTWIDGWYEFKDQPLKNVLNKVEKYYNKTVFVEGEKLPNTMISGKLFLSDKFENVMLYLSKTLETEYELQENGNYLIKDN